MRAGILLVAVVAAASPGTSGAADTVRIRTSAFALERLTPLREMVERSISGIEIEWSGYGSKAAMTPILEGAADVAILSRELDDSEKEMLKRLSVELSERVLALDALSIVVHPSNPIESLTMSQLRNIVDGSLLGWHGVGGQDLDIRLVMPHRLSDDARALGQRLGDDSPQPFAAASEVLETAAAILERVGSEPGALGVVSMSADRGSVKTVPLVAREGEPAVLPTIESVSLDEYPLGRALFLYTRKTMSEPVRRVVSTLLLATGQSAIAEAGFVPLAADRAVTRLLPSPATATGAPLSRVSFAFGASRLNREARQVLDGVAEIARRNGADVWVTGHSEPQEEPASLDRLSAERAESVAAYLRELGIAVPRVEGRGAAELFPSPETPDDPRENRRADVWILPRR